MSSKYGAYGPPLSSDSDDDYYEGFSFGDKLSSEDRRKRKFLNLENKPKKTIENQLYEAVQDDNLDQIKNILCEAEKEGNSFDVNKPCGDTPILHYACMDGNLEIASYLVNIKKADVNTEYYLETPLLCLCKALKRDDDFELKLNKICKLLLFKGAVINVSDVLGMTPLLLACRQGHLGLVKLFIENAALDAADNEGKTAFFHAIEGNHLEVVQFLLDYGINTNVIDRKGYTPIQVAELYGFHDIYEILPKEELKYQVPTTFLCYNSVRDFIPSIFLKTETPKYFQEIYSILTELNLNQYTENFAMAGINLYQFLTINDQKLNDIGIEYQFQRDRIRLGLLYFHLNHWSTKSIARVKKKEPDDFYDILMLSANHLKNLIIVSSTIEYVQQNLQNSYFGKLDLNRLYELKCNVKKYKKTLSNLSKTVKYLHSFRPIKPPLYIDYDDYKIKIKKQNKVKLCFKYSLIIGLSIVVCLKFKDIFQL